MIRTFSPASFLRSGMLAAMALSVAGCGIFGGGDDRVTPTVGNREPILSRIAGAVTPDPNLAGISVVVPPARVNTDWAQVGGTASKAYGHLELSASPARIWTAQIAGSNNRRRLASPPVIGGGTLFAVDTSGMVHAFDAATGSRRWSHQIEVASNLQNASFGGGVTFDNGRVYATNGVGDVVALDASNGAEHWRVKPAGPLRGAPTVAFGTVFAMTQDNQIIALDASDGSVTWQDSGSIGQSGVFGVAAPAAGQGTVIAGYSSGELVAYRYENGRNLWSDALARTSISTQVGTLTDVDADPIIDDGRVFALGQGGRMAAYELLTGQRIWELPLAGISTPALSGDWIFALTDDARLLAIQRLTGRIRWIAQLQAYRNEKNREDPIFWTGPVLASNKLWAASSRGALFWVDVATGTATEYADIGSPVSLPPIIANRVMYILDDSGRITAFR